MHRATTKPRIPEPTLARRVAFGLTVMFGLGALGWLARDERAFVASLALGALNLLLVPVRPVSSALYRGWMMLGLALSKVTSPVLLLVLYLVLITPVALLSRLAGRDPLRLKKRDWGNPKASAWEPRTASEPASYLRQY